MPRFSGLWTYIETVEKSKIGHKSIYVGIIWKTEKNNINKNQYGHKKMVKIAMLI